jgi:hypothetical protein
MICSVSNVTSIGAGGYRYRAGSKSEWNKDMGWWRSMGSSPFAASATSVAVGRR